jgi:hypothetical protein
VIDERSSLVDVAFEVCTALEQAGFVAVLNWRDRCDVLRAARLPVDRP